MKIYAVFVKGYNDGLKLEFNEFIKALDTKEKAEAYANSENKKVQDIYEKIDRQDCACCQCDHEDKCMYCNWNEPINTHLKYISVDGFEIFIDCDPLHGDNPEFVIREIEVS